MRIPSVLILALALLVHPVAAPARDLTVFAAASLKTALDAASARWQAETGNRVAISYAGSSQLARQIENGAPADLFLSANTQWMDVLQQGKLIDPATRRDLWGNALVLVAADPEAPRVTLDSHTDLVGLLKGGKLSMALVDSVPAGEYGKQALTSLGLWAGVAPSVAQSGNVRAALALVAHGDAPYGVVYATDARAEPRVHVVARFPEASHTPILYPGAVTVDAANPAEAAGFLDWLATKGVHDFTAQGFTVIAK